MLEVKSSVAVADGEIWRNVGASFIQLCFLGMRPGSPVDVKVHAVVGELLHGYLLGSNTLILHA